MTSPAEKTELPPDLIVGLGNPGSKHEGDRHNVGFWFIELLARRFCAPSFITHARAKVDYARIYIHEYRVLLIRPQVWMNHSGYVVRQMLDYMKLPATEALIVHDDLDLPPGAARLKSGGGHGGHNGLRDVIGHCGADFQRLRLGVGHPGDRDQVTPYVLSRPPYEEREAIVSAMVAGMLAVETLFRDGMQAAMNQLHAPWKESAAGKKGAAGNEDILPENEG